MAKNLVYMFMIYLAYLYFIPIFIQDLLSCYKLYKIVYLFIKKKQLDPDIIVCHDV